jgi:hypothetical protein
MSPPRAPPEREGVPVEHRRPAAFVSWWIWLFIHIAFQTGYRNRLSGLLTIGTWPIILAG